MAESIGSTLKQRREARHLSIEQAAEQTRVRKYYLQALENDDLSAIPSVVQARGFLRIYTEFLGLNLDELSSATHSAESRSPIPQVASPAEPLPAPASADVSPSNSQPRPGFLSGLRDRFTRHSSPETVAPKVEPATRSEPEPEPEPEVFVPVHVHEELPAAPEESVPPESIDELKSAVKPTSPPRSSSRKRAVKKPVRTKAKKSIAKTTKPSAVGERRKAQVKKKITE
jgi:transcriptional regulator with XRE-family HTH domain